MISYIRHLRIRTKLFFSIGLVILASFTIFAIINTYYLTNDILERQLYNLKQTLVQTQTLLEHTTTTVKYSADIFADQNFTKDYLATPLELYEEQVGLFYLHSVELKKQLVYMQEAPNVSSVDICLSSGLGSLYDSDDYYRLSDYEHTNWYQTLTTPATFYTWAYGGIQEDPEHFPYVTLIRKIPDAQNLLSLNCSIAFNVPLKSLDKILEAAQITSDSTVYLYSTAHGLLTASVDDKELSGILPSLDTLTGYENAQIDTVTLGGSRYLLGYTPIRQSDWVLVIAIPYWSLIMQNVKVYQSILVTLALSLPLILIVGYLFSIVITKPVYQLIQNMKQAEHGDFNIPIAPASRDEIGQLNQSFNVMLTKLSLLMDEKYRLGKEKKNAQLKALQVQINPHFLYNTLDMINVMAINGQYQKIRSAIQALSHYYRSSLNSGSDVATLQDEINHVRSYVEIQNLRFEDAIQLTVEAAPELLSCRMFKICLQPFVENSILHGILEKDSESGTIHIHAWKEEPYLYVSIEDDGVGMDDQTMASLFQKPLNQEGGYGIYNVQERIKINYGNHCGITFQSEPGVGTTAVIKILLKYNESSIHI